MSNLNYPPDFNAFLSQHPVSDLPAPVERLLGDLISGPEKIVELQRDKERILIGVVIDTCNNATNAAEFCLIACALEQLDADALKEALILAQKAAVLGPRSFLEIGVTKPLVGYESLLQSLGFRSAYMLHDMGASKISYTAPSLLSGWSWRDVTGATTTTLLHQTMMEVFPNGPPGVNIPSLNVFLAAHAQKSIPGQLLYCGNDLAGFADVRMDGDMGIINTIGCMPSFRRQGIGDMLLSRSMGQLATHGAVRFALTVAALNKSALGLYQRHGFKSHYTVEVFSIPLAVNI